jgi:hypothetical protein
MSKPIHTPGPLEFLELGHTEEPHNRFKPLTICEGRENGDDIANVYSADDSTVSITREQAIGNARLLAAAYNAFDSAARVLGCNAVELAERMADGGIAALVEAVRAAKQMSDWFMEHSRQADHAHEQLKQPLHETTGWKELVDAGYNGLMASYHGQFEEALAKVKGGAI